MIGKATTGFKERGAETHGIERRSPNADIPKTRNDAFDLQWDFNWPISRTRFRSLACFFLVQYKLYFIQRRIKSQVRRSFSHKSVKSEKIALVFPSKLLECICVLNVFSRDAVPRDFRYFYKFSIKTLTIL